MAAPVAALPMYDWPEIGWANEALWAVLRDKLQAVGIAAPSHLERVRDPHEIWTDRALLLSQTCAWPFITRLSGAVQLVATPAYDCDGCAGAFYSSFLVARADDKADSLGGYRGRRFACNSPDSLSGYVALLSAMRAEALPVDSVGWVQTGGHRESVRAVARGDADLAAIDAVCWALAGRHESHAVARLKVIGRTPLRPGLPMITAGAAATGRIEALRSALVAAVGDPQTLEARQALLLAGIEQLTLADYTALSALAPDTAQAA